MSQKETAIQQEKTHALMLAEELQQIAEALRSIDGKLNQLVERADKKPD